MRIRMNSLLNILLPMCLLGFTGAYLVYFNRIFNENTRWIFFIGIFTFLILRKSLLRFWDPVLVLIISVYLIWCFLTSFWSNVYILSLSKSAMLSLIIITMVTAGIEWVKTRSWENSINYIGLLAYIAFFAAFFGKFEGMAASSIPGTPYRGAFVTGTNMLGFYMAASFPFFLWKAYQQKMRSKKHLIQLLLVLGCGFFLLASMSRGAIAATLATLIGFIFSINLNKKIVFVFFSIIALISLSIFYPDKIMEIVGTYFFKSTYQKNVVQDVLSSRRLVWQKSYDAAVEGGWLGLGYGVSMGDSSFNFDYGLTSSHYGREKGNSQLAIVEETGLVGLILYFVLLLTFLFKLIKLYLKIHDPHQRVLIGILSGIFMGMIAQSIFEGWWDAPAGPETVYFWLLVGVIRGLEITIGKTRAIPVNNFGV